mmetsp:Transcript_2874/g.4190  ORF Transcript_2874/g.4190 Transcript_2874/m.4190 type:complete len:202 (+) Transcript_2874:807-1412(+)
MKTTMSIIILNLPKANLIHCLKRPLSKVHHLICFHPTQKRPNLSKISLLLLSLFIFIKRQLCTTTRKTNWYVSCSTKHKSTLTWQKLYFVQCNCLHLFITWRVRPTLVHHPKQIFHQKRFKRSNRSKRMVVLDAFAIFSILETKLPRKICACWQKVRVFLIKKRKMMVPFGKSLLLPFGHAHLLMCSTTIWYKNRPNTRHI